MRNLCWMICLTGILLLWTGCVDGPGEEDPAPDMSSTGMGLSVDFQGGTDVVGFKFIIARCGGGTVVKEIKDLEDLVLPGMIPEFENEPFDEGSRHLFADYYTVLAAGCYDVEVQPMRMDEAKGIKKPSNDCGADSQEGVEVVDGETTEILLISQCEGAEQGGLDVVASLNHPPVLGSLEFEKFNRECDQVAICATASDPNNDPVELEWQKLQGSPLLSELQVTVSEDINGTLTECIEFDLGAADDYLFEVRAYDLYWEDEELVRFPNSSSGVVFPVYAAERDDLKCPPEEFKYLYY